MYRQRLGDGQSIWRRIQQSICHRSWQSQGDSLTSSLFFRPGNTNRDLFTVQAVAQGVVDEIVEGFAQQYRIALDRRRVTNFFKAEVHFPVERLPDMIAGGFFGKFDEVNRSRPWDAWVAFFTAGFPVQKIVFLPAGTSQEVVDTFVAAFRTIKARSDFAKISSKRLGKYPMYVGADAAAALTRAISVPDSAKAFVKKWLKDDYGVELK